MKKNELRKIITEVIKEENVFVPRNIEGRKEKRLQQLYKLLNQETINGNVEIDLNDYPTFNENFKGKVKYITGNVRLRGGWKELPFNQLEKVDGFFYCYKNQLTSLHGSPQTVGGNFDCEGTQLTTLEGGPQTVRGNFDCEANQLTSLHGSPQTVRGFFNCPRNKLISLEGSPKTVGEDFDCSSNKKQFTKEDVEAVSNVKGDIYV